MKQVYLSGKISGLTHEEANLWRIKATDLLQKNNGYIAVVNPVLTTLNKTPKEIVEDDKANIVKSTHILVYYREPSPGTCMEILYAFERGIRVYLVYDPIDKSGLADIPIWLTYHSMRIFTKLETACLTIIKD